MPQQGRPHRPHLPGMSPSSSSRPYLKDLLWPLPRHRLTPISSFPPLLCEQISQTLILSRPFRLSVLEVLVRVHQSVADPEYVSICQALQFLNRAQEVRASIKRKQTACHGHTSSQTEEEARVDEAWALMDCV